MSLDGKTEKIASEIINSGLIVHKNLGPGLLESAYKECLYYELNAIGLQVVKEKPIPLIYNGIKLECGYRGDLVVENIILVELKAVEELTKIHLAQMLTYLRIGGYRLGFIMNFNVLWFKDGIKRIVI
jgi:GxxExxY protein